MLLKGSTHHFFICGTFVGKGEKSMSPINFQGRIFFVLWTLFLVGTSACSKSQGIRGGTAKSTSTSSQLHSSSGSGGAESPVAAANPKKDTAVTPSDAFDGAVKIIAKNIDGGLLLWGDFTSAKGIIRLDARGIQDEKFSKNLGISFNAAVTSIVVQADGKILIGGDFTDFDGKRVGRILRLDQDGSLDLEFLKNSGTGFNDRVSQIHLRPDGSLLVFGNFTSFDSNNFSGSAKLNADGLPDLRFGVASNEVFTSSTAPASAPPAVQAEDDPDKEKVNHGQDKTVGEGGPNGPTKEKPGHGRGKAKSKDGSDNVNAEGEVGYGGSESEVDDDKSKPGHGRDKEKSNHGHDKEKTWKDGDQTK